MIKNTSIHTFHVPVMGTAFTIDSPVKVAKYGIHSVISLVDDHLIEEMRKFYCTKYVQDYTPITKYDEDYRARRITAYLDLLDWIVQKEFNAVKNSQFVPGSEITKYFELLPDDSVLKAAYHHMLECQDEKVKEGLQKNLREAMKPGDINVNIMTKLDRDNYDSKGNLLAPEFSDGLSALRGYAQSRLKSCIIFSAGFNRRLYGYIENFKDFYADATGEIKKKIILKVSDFRSTLIQGKFLAKKGLWVSEYRIESGLNCGGHAFATDGYLMGPIMEEFKTKRQTLIDDLHKICNEALKIKNRLTTIQPHSVRITAQGGIGNYKEDSFLRKHYNLDGTGWGTPFLLCPEVTNVDPVTMEKLSKATEKDVYLSPVSPLGVPFNNLRDSLSDLERDMRVMRGRPGSACPKSYLVSNTEFTQQPICTASRQYQKLKLEQLASLNLEQQEYKKQFEKIIVKSCICNDLGESVLMNNKVPTPINRFPAVCPGPNIAYFSKIVSLKEMADHIYGRINILNNTYRPHMFIKELRMYVDYLRSDVVKSLDSLSDQKTKYFGEFRNNLLEGIEYYRKLFPQMTDESVEFRSKMINELEECRTNLLNLCQEHATAFSPALAQV